MVNKILGAAGIPHAETLFLQQPEGVFAVWGDKIESSGSDDSLDLLYHEVLVELYEPAEHDGREERAALIAALDDAYQRCVIGKWDCDMRIWLDDVRLFMTSFHFSYTERR